MTHAVRWLALARRTGVWSRNRNSRVRISMLLGRCASICLEQRPQHGRRVWGRRVDPRSPLSQRLRGLPGGAAVDLRRAQPLAAAPPGASSLSSPRRTGGSEVIRIVKERPGTNVRPGSGRKKTPVKLRACRGLFPGGRAGCPKTASLQVDVWRLTSWAPSAAGERSRHDLRNADRANRSRKK